MRVLFIHQNFPGQFLRLAPALAARGHQLKAIRQKGQGPHLAGVDIREYTLEKGNTPGVHPFAQEFESKVIRAQACAQIAQALKKERFIPDLILAHPGWGEPLYLKDLFPKARQILQTEYYYRAQGQDMGFDPEFPPPTLEDLARIRTKNANLCAAFDQMDQGICPTQWQASTHPHWVRDRLRVIHEGIDTDLMSPDETASVTLPDRQITVTPTDEVVTFVARNLEPVRGYHIFMRALPGILARRPKAKVFIVGGDGVSYGSPPASGNYRQIYLDEVAAELDPKRIFFMGRINYSVYRRLLQISRCHVYLTYPFVLSWSMLEAMSCGTLVVGSRTPPVEEVIKHNENGLLVDFFDVPALTNTVVEALAHPLAMSHCRTAARQTILERFDLQQHCLPQLLDLLENPA
ncbi:glycosyl transferase family 1 [Ectothiorhodospira haloalkaliphila]|uniref:Glycosyl transferase family 1 n=1 Tax=Ectothiorhodospira haloalkaliphila TaxID=421628 RepID=W8KTJ0_9GAMM|nr:glycosyltransferase [Ectothiorhodospira haloalkaliphila]AHK78911.1 glycosyl transferase family 1 [Ectothiorhodospira haloalkaliphila]